MKESNISRGDIRRILNGDFDPLNFSEPRFKNKLKELRELNQEYNKTNKRKRSLNEDSFYPKYELKDILRDLKFQRLDEEFFYDKIKAPIIPVNNQSKVLPLPTTNRQVASVQTPPLPPTPGVNPNLVASTPPINQQTGLTHSENALLSNEEKAIKLRSKGMA